MAYKINITDLKRTAFSKNNQEYKTCKICNIGLKNNKFYPFLCDHCATPVMFRSDEHCYFSKFKSVWY